MKRPLSIDAKLKKKNEVCMMFDFTFNIYCVIQFLSGIYIRTTMNQKKSKHFIFIQIIKAPVVMKYTIIPDVSVPNGNGRANTRKARSQFKDVSVSKNIEL